MSPSKLAHVVCLTNQLAAMRDWYVTLLNATVSFENPDLCFLRYDEEHHRIGLIRFDGLEAQPAGTVVVDHFSFTYRDLPELLGTYLRLESLGIEPFWTINHGPTTSMYYKDPDGHKIELQVDNFTEEECDAFFAAGNYETNPIGVIFEPEAWIQRYADGEPVASITRRPDLPAGVSPFDMIRF
ncbi:MAG: VOC family protein [Paraburkholderia sp.]|nr:VOC family protein [Paraburkholderia sp.]